MNLDIYKEIYPHLHFEETELSGSFKCKVRAPDHKPQTFIQESINSATRTSVHFNERIFLPFSGGVDSEALVESFRLAKVNFQPVIFKYNDDCNIHDVSYAFEYCKKHSLSPLIVDFDLDRFFQSNEHLEIAKNYLCRSPQLAVHIACIKQINGCVVLPHNPIALYNDRSDFFWEFPKFLYYTYDRYFSANDMKGIGCFFLSDRDLIYSYLCSRIYFELLSRPQINWEIYSRDTYLIKCMVYYEGGFKNIWPREYKATGFEIYRKRLNQKNIGKYKFDYFDESYRLSMESIFDDRNITFRGAIDLRYLYNFWLERKWING